MPFLRNIETQVPRNPPGSCTRTCWWRAPQPGWTLWAGRTGGRVCWSRWPVGQVVLVVQVGLVGLVSLAGLVGQVVLVVQVGLVDLLGLVGFVYF